MAGWPKQGYYYEHNPPAGLSSATSAPVLHLAEAVVLRQRWIVLGECLVDGGQQPRLVVRSEVRVAARVELGPQDAGGQLRLAPRQRRLAVALLLAGHLDGVSSEDCERTAQRYWTLAARGGGAAREPVREGEGGEAGGGRARSGMRQRLLSR